jgi:hypothetical protein
VRLAIAVLLAEFVAVSISAAPGNYVLNGDFDRGHDHWDGDGVVISDPDNKEDRVLKIKLDDYAKGISQRLTLPPATTALVGGFRVRLINPRTKFARASVQAWLRLKGKEQNLLIGAQYLDNGRWARIIIPPVSVRDIEVDNVSIEAIGMDCDVLLDDVVLVTARVSGRVGSLRPEDSDDAPSPKIGEPIHMTGHELEAISVAIADFKKRKYSVSADLSHYTVEIQRHANEIEVTFMADAGPNGPQVGGGSVYGVDVHYSVAVDPVKTIRVHFYR